MVAVGTPDASKHPAETGSAEAAAASDEYRLHGDDGAIGGDGASAKCQTWITTREFRPSIGKVRTGEVCGVRPTARSKPEQRFTHLPQPR